MNFSGALDWCGESWARVYKVVDDLPEDATAEPFAAILDLAWPDDDGRLDQDELIALDEPDTMIAAGEVSPLSEARPEFDL